MTSCKIQVTLLIDCLFVAYYIALWNIFDGVHNGTSPLCFFLYWYVVLCCVVLCCVVLCCVVMCCVVLCCVVLCVVLCCVVLCCVVLCCVVATVPYLGDRKSCTCSTQRRIGSLSNSPARAVESPCTPLDCGCCTVLRCTVLYCTIPYYGVLYCSVLCCAVLCCTVLYCTVPDKECACALNA